MPSPPPTLRLLGFSPFRTLIVRRGESTDEVIKLFESGGMAAAEHELRFAQLLAGPGVATPHRVEQDAETGKPAIASDLIDGTDLETLVLEYGAIASGRVLPLVQKLARTLERIHTTRGATASHGYVHGDIKPANLLASDSGDLVLLDFEHSCPHLPDTQPTGRFSGGTHGYAPPEAYTGHAPTPAFDIFGFGCTLHFLLTGALPYADDDAVRQDRRRRRVLDACTASLREIVDLCLAPSPELRPSAAELALRLDATEVNAEDTLLDNALSAVLAGEYAEASELLAGATPQNTRRAALTQLRDHLRKLLLRLDEPTDFEPPLETAEIAVQLAEAAPWLAAFRLRFPNHTGARNCRIAMLRGRNTLLERVAAEIQTAKNEARFDAAFALLDGTQAAVRATVPLGRSHPRELDIPYPPTAMQRDPLRFLALHRRDVEQAMQVDRALLEKLEQAEAALDLELASRVIREFSAVYGGASRVVADLKDRLHRLDFYLDRIGRMAPLLQAVEEQAEIAEQDIDLGPTASFFQACRDRALSDSDVFGPTTTENLRTLRRSLVDLLRQYPHLVATAQSALDALDAALATLTDWAWQLTEEAEHKLTTPPIPIRPLQSVINRLDDLRMRELLVDRPERPRAMLLDCFESIRMRLDQARSTRDSIARGARESMDRGHLTTAIYDMKRAVDQFGDDEHEHDQDGVDSGSSPRLAEQFEEARRRKQQVEDAQKRNHVLAAKYAELADDPASRRRERLTVLEEREEVLLFLCQNSGAERTENYRLDLNDAHVAFILERAAEGEHHLANIETAGHRLEVIEKTLSALRQHAPEAGMEPGRPVTDALERWQALFDHESRSITRKRQTQPSRTRWSVPAMAALLVIAIGFAVYPQLARAGRLGLDTFAEKLERELPDDPAGVRPGTLLIGLQRYIAELRRTEVELPAGLSDAALHFLEAAEKTVIDRTLDGFAEEVSQFDKAIPQLRSHWSRRPDATLVIASLQHFGRCAHVYGFRGAKVTDTAARKRHDELTKDLSIRLPKGL